MRSPSERRQNRGGPSHVVARHIVAGEGALARVHGKLEALGAGTLVALRVAAQIEHRVLRRRQTRQERDEQEHHRPVEVFS